MDKFKIDGNKITVDRIENGLAVCESGGGLIEIPVTQISGAVKEGDILKKAGNGSGYIVARAETELRRAAIRERFERIKARNK